MSRYLDPKADVVFKKIFGDHPHLLMSFLNDRKLRLLWLRFLREIDEKTKAVSHELLEVPEIAEAIQLAEEAAYTEGELDIYEGYWDQVRREKTLMIDKYIEGRAKGFAEGEARGIEKIAINMLKANKPVDEIILFTGLSRQAVAQLHSDMK